MDFLRRQVSKMPLGARGNTSGSLSSPSTEHIIPKQQSSSSEYNAAAPIQETDELADGDRPVSSVSQASLPSSIPSSGALGDAKSFERYANITIAILDPKLPVSLWTSLNSWKSPLPMMGLGKDAFCRLHFICEVDDVPDRPFHYKVQTGDGKWVLDETKPIGKHTRNTLPIGLVPCVP